MQSGQDCLIYHMLGNSLRRLHVSRAEIGSLLTGWFAERLWVEPACSSPQSTLQTLPSCCVHSRIYSGCYKDFFNRWKVKAKWVQSADCHDSEHRTRGSRKLSCKNTVREDSTPCQVWVGEKFRALQDAQLCSVPEFAIDFGLCKKLKPPAISVKGLLRVHKRREASGKVWTCHDPSLESALPKGPTSSPRRGSAQLEQCVIHPWGKGWLYIHKSLFCGCGTS